MSDVGPAAARTQLVEAIGQELARPVPAALQALVEHARARHGETVAAVLFYGSCLRQGAELDLAGSVLDLYVLVDAYGRAFRRRLAAWANRQLPPNVFFVDLPWGRERVRAKYAVVSVDQFRRRSRDAAAHPYFWARFAQPMRLVHARDEAIADAVRDGLVDALATFASQTAALVEGPVDPRRFWSAGLGATFRAELRSEGPERAGELAVADGARIERLTLPALRAAGLRPVEAADGTFTVPLDAEERRRRMKLWRRSWLIGKPLSLARLAKALFTFEGGVDYVLYKIERHTGRRPEISPFERRHPLLCAPILLWRARSQKFAR